MASRYDHLVLDRAFIDAMQARCGGFPPALEHEHVSDVTGALAAADDSGHGMLLGEIARSFDPAHPLTDQSPGPYFRVFETMNPVEDQEELRAFARKQLGRVREQHEAFADMPSDDRIIESGIDIVLLGRVAVGTTRLVPEVTASAVERVMSGKLKAADLNEALQQVMTVAKVSSLHRHDVVLRMLGFDVALVNRCHQRRLLDGTGLRSLVHRVATGQLRVEDANTGFSEQLERSGANAA